MREKKSRIDWIFFSEYFNKLDKTHKVTNPFFKTDHFVVEQTFTLNKDQNNINKKKDDHSKIYSFSINDSYFKNKEYVEEVNKEFIKIGKMKKSAGEKLEMSIKEAFEISKRTKKKIKESLVEKRKIINEQMKNTHLDDE